MEDVKIGVYLALVGLGGQQVLSSYILEAIKLGGFDIRLSFQFQELCGGQSGVEANSRNSVENFKHLELGMTIRVRLMIGHVGIKLYRSTLI